MAIGKKTGGRDFQKGHGPNGAGRKKLSENEQRIRELAKKHFHFLLEKLMLSKKDFEKYVKSDNASMFSHILAASISGKDHFVWNKIMDKLLGKDPENINLNSSNTNTNINLQDLPVEQREKITLAYLEKIRSEKDGK